MPEIGSAHLQLVVSEGVEGEVDALAGRLALDSLLEGAGARVADVVLPQRGEGLQQERPLVRCSTGHKHLRTKPKISATCKNKSTKHCREPS